MMAKLIPRDPAASRHAQASRKAQAILRLGEKYGTELEAACERALAFGNHRYQSLKAMPQRRD